MADGKKFVKYGDKQFPMDDVSLEQAKQIMARHFPELADPDVKTEKQGEDTIYVFTKKAGRKGINKNVPTRDVQRVLGKVKAAPIPPALIAAALERAAGHDVDLVAVTFNRQVAERDAVDRLNDRLLDVQPAVSLTGDVLL